MSLALVNASAVAGPLDTWHWRNPVPTGSHLWGAGSSGSRFIVVGELGTILASDDGKNWYAADSPTEVTLRAVTWGNGHWVAVGDAGMVLTSPDGLTWTQRATPYFFNLTGITWGSGLFVAVGENTGILTSADGQTWDLRATGSDPLRSVAWGNGIFVGVGGKAPISIPYYNFTIPGQPLAMRSDDGVSWTSEAPPVAGQLTSVTFGNDRFVAGSTALQTISSDTGVDWIPGLQIPTSRDGNFMTMGSVDGRFLALFGNPTTVFGSYYTSLDGQAWSLQRWELANSGFPGSPVALASGLPGMIVIGHEMGISIQSSAPFVNLEFTTDGLTWREGARQLTDIEPNITFAGGRYFMREYDNYVGLGGYQPDTTFFTSTDPQKWGRIQVSNKRRYELPAYGNGVWVAPGENGGVAVSTNALAWREIDTGNTNKLTRAAWLANAFLASGANGTILQSVDGTNWALVQLSTTNEIGDLAWHAGTYVAAESGAAAIWTSTDSIHWTRHLLPPEIIDFVRILSWDEGFVAQAYANTDSSTEILRSDDGINWAPETPPSSDLTTIAAGGGKLLAFRNTQSGSFYSRNVGETEWSSHLFPWPASAGTAFFLNSNGAVYGDSTFVIVSWNGFILQSEPLADLAPVITQPLSAVASGPSADVTLRSYAIGSTPLKYQWRRDGTNMIGETTPFLTLAAGDISTHSITVYVSNSLSATESAPATVTVASPASLEISPDGNSLMVDGTPGASYRVDFRDDLSTNSNWAFFGGIELHPDVSSGPVKDIHGPVYYALPNRFFRAILDTQ